VGLGRGPLSLVSTTEELFDRKSSRSDLENREYGRTDPSCWPRGTVYPQKLALTSPSSGGHPVGVIRSRTQATEFFLRGTFGVEQTPPAVAISNVAGIVGGCTVCPMDTMALFTNA
jgi:hypothetical protein